MTDPQPPSAAELLPCPFCGGHPRLRVRSDVTAVTCDGCSCMGTPFLTDDDGDGHAKPNAIAAWNRRAATHPTPADATRDRIARSRDCGSDDDVCLYTDEPRLCDACQQGVELSDAREEIAELLEAHAERAQPAVDVEKRLALLIVSLPPKYRPDESKDGLDALHALRAALSEICGERNGLMASRQSLHTTIREIAERHGITVSGGHLLLLRAIGAAISAPPAPRSCPANSDGAHHFRGNDNQRDGSGSCVCGAYSPAPRPAVGEETLRRETEE